MGIPVFCAWHFAYLEPFAGMDECLGRPVVLGGYLEECVAFGPADTLHIDYADIAFGQGSPGGAEILVKFCTVPLTYYERALTALFWLIGDMIVSVNRYPFGAQSAIGTVVDIVEPQLLNSVLN